MDRNRRNRLSVREETRLSKLMALVLRHQPDRVGIELDEHGAVDIDELTDAVADLAGWEFLRPEHIIQLVKSCPRERFQMDEEKHTVRASYGHSLDREVVYEPSDPPAKLYAGMSDVEAEAAREEGLLPVDRQYVHLSTTPRIAYEVGSRHVDDPVVLAIDTVAAGEKGVVFYRATDEIWLTKGITPEFLVEWDKLGADFDEEWDDWDDTELDVHEDD